MFRNLLYTCLLLTTVLPESGMTAANQEQLRIGKHDSYARLVFDYPTKTNYQLSQNGNILTITFANTFDGSIKKAQQLSGYITKAEKDGSKIQFTLKPAIGVSRHFYHPKNNRHSIVIDLKPGLAPKAEAKSVPVKVVEKKAPEKLAPVAVEKETIKINSQAGDISLLLPLPEGDETVKLATFTRAGLLWIVTQPVIPITAEQLPEGAEIISHTESSIILVSLDTFLDTQPYAVIKEDKLFITSQQPNSYQIKNIPVQLDVPNNKYKRVIAKMQDYGQPVEMTDPLVGDYLYILPTAINSPYNRGVRHAYPLYDLLPTGHGLAVAAYQKLPSIYLKKDQVIIGRLTEKEQKIAESPELETALTEPQEELTEKTEELFAYGQWRLGNTDSFYEKKQELQRKILRSHLRNRQEARFALAKFLFAHGFNAEAGGILQQLLENNEAEDLQQEILPLRAATLFLSGRYSEAEKLFQDSKISPEYQKEFNLWHAANLGSLEQLQKAKALLAKQPTVAIPNDYPVRTTQALVEPLANALLFDQPSTEALRMAELLIEDFKHKFPTGNRQERLKLLQARYDTTAGKPNKARDLWKELVNSRDRWVASNARLYNIEYDLQNERITPKEAIEQLERLRFVWRGGRFEYNLINLLGELYLEQKQYRQALTVWKQGLNIQQYDSEEFNSLYQKIQQTFADIYQNDKLSPLQALSFFDEFQEFVPENDQGDKIIQKLADQLVAVDLLSRAGDLLQHQVTKRLEGTDKAIVGARLALVQLLDDKPQEALQALELSRGVYMSEQLKQHRRYLRARALAMKGSVNAALIALGNDRTLQAERLKAELYWDKKDYLKTASTLQKAIKMQNPPSDTDILNLALSLSLAGRESELQYVAKTHEKRMASSDYKQTFELITQPIADTSSTSQQLSTDTIKESFRQLTAYNDFLAQYRSKLKEMPLSQLN